jgi:hypothetical protein
VQTQASSDLSAVISVVEGIVYILVPPIDLCTGMSILYLYHILGINKRSEISQQSRKNVNPSFDSLSMDESEKQLKERLYNIKIKENRAAQHHTIDCQDTNNS